MLSHWPHCKSGSGASAPGSTESWCAPLSSLLVDEDSLEIQFHGQLYLPGRKSTGNGAECTAGDIRSCGLKIGLIEQIEKLSPKFQPGRFRDGQMKLLLDAQIELKEGVAARDVSPGVAKGRGDRRSRQTSGVEIAGNRIGPGSMIGRIAEQIRAQRHPTQKRRQVISHRRWAVTEIDRLPARHGVDSAQGPAADD